MGSHEIRGLNRSQGNHPFIRAPIPHHPDGLDRQEDRKGLTGEVIPTLSNLSLLTESGQVILVRRLGILEFLEKYGIGSSQKVRKFGLNRAKNSNAQTRPREWMTVDH
jgi:hypothetical protein